MVIVKVNNDEYYMDGFLKADLDRAKELIKKKWDFLIILAGIERGGKSTLGKQCCYYVDPTFNMDRICFTAYEFRNACINALPGQAVLFDEAYRGMGARQSMTFINNMIMNVLTEIGQKNLFMFIVLPSYFELDKYPAIHRSEFLIQVEAPDRERGTFKVYDRDRKLQLYIRGKKFYDMSVAKPNYFGRFTKFEPVDPVAYEEKKKKSLESLLKRSDPVEKLGKMAERLRAAHMPLLYWCNYNLKMKYETLSQITGESKFTIGTHIRTFETKKENLEILEKLKMADWRQYIITNLKACDSPTEPLTPLESLPNDMGAREEIKEQEEKIETEEQEEFKDGEL